MLVPTAYITRQPMHRGGTHADQEDSGDATERTEMSASISLWCAWPFTAAFSGRGTRSWHALRAACIHSTGTAGASADCAGRRRRRRRRRHRAARTVAARIHARGHACRRQRWRLLIRKAAAGLAHGHQLRDPRQQNATDSPVPAPCLRPDTIGSGVIGPSTFHRDVSGGGSRVRRTFC